jgi:hypothetical protein
MSLVLVKDTVVLADWKLSGPLSSEECCSTWPMELRQFLLFS